MRCLKVTSPDINNGLGTRVTIWFAGCSHHCKKCHNEWTWDYDIGEEWSYDSKSWSDVITALSKPYIRGITLSGGDPLCHSDADLNFLCESICKLKELFPNIDIWLYTGYYLYEIKDDVAKMNVVNLCDYVVDGPFEYGKRDITIAFRGSKNQNIWKKNNNGEFVIFAEE